MTKGSSSAHTPAPWPMEWTGDGKRIVIGKGLVEGPNGYEVAEVYSDDCPREVAEANARLIAASPTMLEALKHLDELAMLTTEQTRMVRAAIAAATGAEK